MITPYSTGSPDVDALRRAFSGFPGGVAAVTAGSGAPDVLIVSSFTTGVSQDPPLVMFAVQRSSTTWPGLRTQPTLGLSVLGQTHADVVRQLAGRNRPNRLTGISTAVSESGSIFLHDAPIWLETAVEHEYPAGNHDIVVLRVRGLRSDFGLEPLV